MSDLERPAGLTSRWWEEPYDPFPDDGAERIGWFHALALGAVVIGVLWSLGAAISGGGDPATQPAPPPAVTTPAPPPTPVAPPVARRVTATGRVLRTDGGSLSLIERSGRLILVRVASRSAGGALDAIRPGAMVTVRGTARPGAAVLATRILRVRR